MISLFTGEERSAKRERLCDPLRVLNEHIDFVALAQAVDAKLKIGGSGRGGRPSYGTEWEASIPLHHGSAATP